MDKVYILIAANSEDEGWDTLDASTELFEVRKSLKDSRDYQVGRIVDESDVVMDTRDHFKAVAGGGEFWVEEKIMELNMDVMMDLMEMIKGMED